MRRIIAILIVIFIGFWVAYGLVPPVKATVDGFMLKTVGPTVFNAFQTAYASIITNIGLRGFAAIVLGSGFIVGIIAHLFWVKADWKLRRWGHERTAKDLGVTPVTDVQATTPPGATTRPATTTQKAPVVEEKAQVVEETKEETSET